jgi:hypothetical protein
MKQPRQKISDLIFKNAFLFLIVWYVFSCLVHLIYQRPLWNDEACVFQSIQYLTPHELFSEPLRALQVFPRVYLFAIQKFSAIFDFSLWSLRLPAFLCMMTAFILWLKIAREELKSSWERFCFVLTWTASIPLIYYSAELKQYSMDVLAGAVFVLFTYQQEKLSSSRDKRYLLMLIALPLFALFSYPAFLLASLPMINLVLLAKKNKTKNSYIALMVYLGMFFSVAIISYFFDMRLRPVDVLTREWGTYFISMESVGKFFETWWEGTDNLFSRWLVEHPKVFRKIGRVVFAVAFIALLSGIRTQWRKEKMVRTVPIVAFVLFIELIVMGILHKYPYTVPRTSLFFAPMAFLLAIQGVERIYGWNKTVGILAKCLYTGYLLFLTGAIARVVLFQYLGAQSSIF